MIKRKKRSINWGMGVASLAALNSYCERKQVGAAITKKDRIISTGWNGTPASHDNCCEALCDRCNGTGQKLEPYNDNPPSCVDCGGTGLKSKTTIIHAEANAILFAAKEGTKLKGTTLYVTMSPCAECAKMIIQAGIKKVVYKEKYRLTDGISLLKESKIKVKQYEGK